MISDGNLKAPENLYSYLKDLFKDALQEMLETELDYEKGDRKNKATDNLRNGYGQRTVKSKFGDIHLEVPRDRNREFEPSVVPKNKRDISDIEDKIIFLYARGIFTRDIHKQVQDIYAVEMFAEMVSKIIDKLLPHITEWEIGF